MISRPAMLAALAAALIAVSAPAAATAAPVVLSGALSGFTRPSLGRLEVLAVNADDGTVADVVAPRTASYRLSVPPGPYLVNVRSEDFRRGTTTGLTDVVSVGSPGGLIPVVPGGPPALAAATGGPVIAIPPMTVTADPGSGLRSGSMQGQVINGLFDRCHDKAHYRIVEGDPKILGDLQREQQLKDQGRITADFAYNPTTPGYKISGSATVDANGNVIVTLTLTDLKTGKTLDKVRGRGDAKDIDGLIRRFARGLAERDCHDGKPPGPLKPKPKRRQRRPRARRHSASGPFTASYEGTFKHRSVSADGALVSTTVLKFYEEITVRLNKMTIVSTTKTLTASGTFEFSGPGAAGGDAKCTLSASGPTLLPMSITPNPSLPGGLVDRLIVGVHVPGSIDKGALSIAGDPGCRTVSGTLYPGDVKDDWNAAVAPGPTIKVADLPFSQSYPVDDHFVGTGGADETVTMTGVLTVR